MVSSRVLLKKHTIFARWDIGRDLLLLPRSTTKDGTFRRQAPSNLEKAAKTCNVPKYRVRNIIYSIIGSQIKIIMNIFDSPTEESLHNHNDMTRPLGSMSDDSPIGNHTGVAFAKAASGVIASFASYLLFFVILCRRLGCGCESRATVARVERSIVKKV